MLDLSDPSTLQGNYKLSSVTIRSVMIEPNPLTIMAGEWKQVTFHAGELTWPQLVTYTYSGTLSLISSRYTMSTLVETSDTDGSNADQESLDDDGSYSLNGSVMTFTSDDNEDQISQSDEANLRVTARQLALRFLRLRWCSTR